MSQRWLILTSSTGSGHDTRAYALRDWAREYLGEGAVVEVWHVLEETSLVGAFGVWLYNQIQRHWPALHQIYWHIAEGWNWLNERWVSSAGKRFAQRLRRDRPDLLISVHDSLNAAYFRAARRILGEDRVQCVTYCGEWSSGYGFSRHWVDPKVDLFVARTESAADYAKARGVPAERTFVFRNLLRRGDFATPLEAPAVRAYRRDRLGLDPDRFTLLLASGALGADHHHRMLAALLPLAGRVQAIALCGRNERARQRVEAWAARRPELRLAVCAYTEEMPQLFQSAHAVLTRGGSNTMAECVHFGCPVLFHAERGMMPQEYCTRRFLEAEGIGRLVPSPRALTAQLEDWTAEGSRDYAAVRARFEALRDASHPQGLIAALAALPGKAG